MTFGEKLRNRQVRNRKSQRVHRENHEFVTVVNGQIPVTRQDKLGWTQTYMILLVIMEDSMSLG